MMVCSIVMSITYFLAYIIVTLVPHATDPLVVFLIANSMASNVSGVLGLSLASPWLG
jgi:hypothetical protein